MNKYIISLIIAVLCSLLHCHAAAYDTWSTYFSMRSATQVVDADGKCYAVMSGNVVMYDAATAEVRTIDKISAGLSDAGVLFIGYSHSKHSLVIAYSDGNIDIYDEKTGNVRNIPQFKDNPDDDFALNNLFVQDNDIVLSTNEGVIWMTVSDGVIQGRYAVGACSAGAVFAGRIYGCLKSYGVFSALLTDNILDLSRWERVEYGLVTQMCVYNGLLYYLMPATTRNVNAGLQGISFFSKEAKRMLLVKDDFTDLVCNERRIVAYREGYALEIPIDGSAHISYELPKDYGMLVPNGRTGKEFWTSRAGKGVEHTVCAAAGSNFTCDYTAIAPDGPFCEAPYFMDYFNGKLYMAAGITDPNDHLHFPFCASYLDEDGKWFDFERPTREGGWLSKHVTVLRDATSIVEDRFDSGHHFVTSGSHGVFEYRNGRIVAQYTHGNSAMESCSGSKSLDFVRTDAALMDKDGNLFVANNSVDTVIWGRKPNGKWIPFYNGTIARVGYFEKSLIDSKGRLWFFNRRTDNLVNAGILCLDYGQTIDNPNDDVYTYRSGNFKNQDGTNFAYLAANTGVQDLTGRIWIGTDAGLVVVDDPDTWGNSDFHITQVKVPRNDGTNYADYLLNGVYITDIAVDGANRKWIGTQGDGVYFVSADGTVILHHFTKKDSPIISDNVYSIVCHPQSGEVFIATDAGLVSYQSDASEAEPTLSRDNLRVYPNPVRPDYSGPIILDGLVYDSEVKVVSVGGQVVAVGNSLGGTFTWDGRGSNGERVASGVYHFMITSPDGKQSVVAKVAVVR